MIGTLELNNLPLALLVLFLLFLALCAAVFGRRQNGGSTGEQKRRLGTRAEIFSGIALVLLLGVLVFLFVRG